jgi:ABC-type transport system involved in Fe-S cluster assembly fused permease/ATPase subunit
MELSFLAENGKSCFQSIYERCASFNFDEPTAALDARAEYEVFQRFAELTKGKSAVLISHRFSTARLADRILVLENGTLLESGTHQDLLKADGRYAELLIYKQEVINNKMIIF